jgi:hypothetical protein
VTYRRKSSQFQHLHTVIVPSNQAYSRFVLLILWKKRTARFTRDFLTERLDSEMLSSRLESSDAVWRTTQSRNARTQKRPAKAASLSADVMLKTEPENSFSASLGPRVKSAHSIFGNRVLLCRLTHGFRGFTTRERKNRVVSTAAKKVLW